MLRAVSHRTNLKNAMIQTIHIAVEVATPASFAPYGHMIGNPTEPPCFLGRDYATWRFPIELRGAPDLTLLRYEYRRIASSRFERHPFMSELRVPLDRSASVIFVSSSDDQPTPESIRAFVIAPHVAVLIARNRWHSGSYPLDARGANYLLISDRETEAELEEATRKDLVPSCYTNVCDWTGSIEFVAGDLPSLPPV